jgi:hypothetical protein
MRPSHPGSPCIEVDFDTCFLKPERLAGSLPGAVLLPGEKLHCLTHGLTVVQHQPSYFQALETCMLVALANPDQRPRRATRLTTCLTADDIVKLYLAVLRANLLGMPLTYFATISWTTLGLKSDAEIQAATQALFVRLREWSQRKRDPSTGASAPIPLSWIWCHERGPHLGLHTHLLMHAPQRNRPQLGKIICRFLERQTGHALVQRDGEGRSTFKAIEPRAPRSTPGRAVAVRFQRRLTRYLMKDLDPKAVVPDAVVRQRGQHLRAALRVKTHESSGPIQGKRCGYSVHNLGKAAFSQSAGSLGLAADQAELILARSGFAFDDEALVTHDVSRLRPR